MRSFRVIAGSLVAALLLTGVAGCVTTRSSDQAIAPLAYEGADTAESPVVTDEGKAASDGYGAEMAGSPAEQSARSSGVDASVDRMIVRNASLELRVDDVDAAIAAVRTAVRDRDGEIAELSTGGGVPLSADRVEDAGPTQAWMVIRVDAEKLDALSDELAGLGVVVSQAESASDVTEQAIDMEARLKNLRAEESRLRSFLDRTNKVSELLAVEAELARVRGEIESMDAQLTYLKRQAARATLSVTLSEPESVTGTESPWYRLRQAFARGVQGAIRVVEALVTIAVGAIPLIVLIGGGAWALIAGLNRRHRRRLESAAGSSGAAGQTYEDDSNAEG